MPKRPPRSAAPTFRSAKTLVGQHQALPEANIGALLSLLAILPSVDFVTNFLRELLQTARGKQGNRLLVDTGAVDFGRRQIGWQSTIGERYDNDRHVRMPLAEGDLKLLIRLGFDGDPE